MRAGEKERKREMPTTSFSILEISVLRQLIVLVILAGTSSARNAAEGAVEDKVRIMLGSCNKVERKQPFWELIIGRRPDAWVWMGDNVYADTKRSSPNVLAQFIRVLRGEEPTGYESIMFEPSDLTRLRKMYEAQKAHPGYKELREKIPIYGTWDDHDYGINDGDYRYTLREESKQAFLDFLDVSKSDARRQRNGVYAAHDVRVGDREVKIVLLDNRYNKSPYCSWPFRSLCRGGEDFLGEEQWEWLEQTLAESRSDANIVVSGIQILTEHRWHGENWARFPKSRQRLLDVLLSSGAKNLILFSGDVHFAEVSRAVCQHGERADETRELLEMTSSGMTHSWGTGPLNGRILLALVMWIMPFRFQSIEGIFTGLNIAQIDFQWKKEEAEGMAVLKILDPAGNEHLMHQVPLTSSSHRHDAADAGWTCKPHRGDPLLVEVIASDTIIIGIVLVVPLACVFWVLKAVWRLLRGKPKRKTA